MLQGCCGDALMAHEHGSRYGLSRMAVWTGGARERAGGVPSAFITLFMVRPLLPGLLLSRSLYPAPYTCTSDT